ncbi:hypothetical protein AB0D10_19580 [Kitasatospora sp. NPDC048545]|uniref:hypothetical protein n=1 Tax=Kitasatospora sp. NPDC048545 TaxID=3157208 RepID=UPI0033F7EBC9
MLSCRKYACTAAAAIVLVCGALAGAAQAATGHPSTSGPAPRATVSTTPGDPTDPVVATPKPKDPGINNPGDWRWE